MALQFLRAPLSYREWERVMFYSKRVKVFANKFDIGTHPILLKALKDAPEPLFPNLLSFKWPLMGNPGDDMNLLDSFISNRLFDLTINGNGNDPGVVIATLQTLPRATVGVSLRSLKLNFSSNSHPDFLQSYRSFLRSMTTLESLGTSVDDQGTYADIAQLPNLRRLSLRITTKSAWPLDLLSTVQSPFPHLQTLSLWINTVNLSLFSRFLQLAHFDQLESIYLRIPFFEGHSTTHRDPGSDFLGLANTIATQCSTDQLRHFSIDVTDAYFDMFNEYPTITAHHLLPLLGFKRMQGFSLNVDWKLDFDNTTLETIASSWPLLDYLSLAPRSSSKPPQITFSGLQALRVCPNIVSFDSSFVDDVSSPESYESIDKGKLPKILSVSFLDVGDSELTNSHNMARYLAALFPNLEEISYDQGTPLGPPVQKPNWDSVNDYLSNPSNRNTDVAPLTLA